MIGDRLGFCLELLRDRARQDVEEQALRPKLLAPQGDEGVLALLREQGQQGEHDRAANDHVERDHRAQEPRRERRRAAKQLAGEARREEDDEEGDEPADTSSDIVEDERTERREDAPQTHPTRSDEAAERDHGRRRREQDGEELDPEQEPEVPRPSEDQVRPEDHAEVHVGQVTGLRTKGQVEGAPDERDGQDQDRDQHQERLAQARVVVVPGVGTDQGQTGEQRVNSRSDGVHRPNDTQRLTGSPGRPPSGGSDTRTRERHMRDSAGR